MTISVIIPAIEVHVLYLGMCVKSIYEQTLLPDEVIISISNISNIYTTKANVEEMIGQYRDKLNIIISYTIEKKYAGENRNIAIALSTGDLISMIDADDIMLPNRLEVLKNIFDDNYDCVGVLHFFIENTNITPYIENISIKKYKYTDKLHYGHPTFRRIIFDKFKYSDAHRGQDFQFIESLLPTYLNNLYICEQPLTCYYSKYSTFYNRIKQ